MHVENVSGMVVGKGAKKWDAKRLPYRLESVLSMAVGNNALRWDAINVHIMVESVGVMLVITDIIQTTYENQCLLIRSTCLQTE